MKKNFRDSLIVKKVLVKVKKPQIDLEYKEFEETRRLNNLNSNNTSTNNEKSSPRRSEKITPRTSHDV